MATRISEMHVMGMGILAGAGLSDCIKFQTEDDALSYAARLASMKPGNIVGCKMQGYPMYRGVFFGPCADSDSRAIILHYDADQELTARRVPFGSIRLDLDEDPLEEPRDSGCDCCENNSCENSGPVIGSNSEAAWYIVNGFLSSCCISTAISDDRTEAAELYEVFSWWCENMTIKPLSAKVFSTVIKKMGYVHSKVSVNYIFGVRIRPEVQSAWEKNRGVQSNP